MKTGTTAIVSYLFVLERLFRNEEEDRERACGGALRIDSSEAFCGWDVTTGDLRGVGTLAEVCQEDRGTSDSAGDSGVKRSGQYGFASYWAFPVAPSRIARPKALSCLKNGSGIRPPLVVGTSQVTTPPFALIFRVKSMICSSLYFG